MRKELIRRNLSRFKVGIAGAGGLGSNCAMLLARSGVGTLLIADYDRVALSNLDRQFYFRNQIGMLKCDALWDNIAAATDGLRVMIHPVKLTPANIADIFNGCDAIVEALDEASEKEMFITTVQRELPGVPVVAGSGLAGWGSNETLRMRKLDDTLYVCGDESVEVSDDKPPTGPRVAIVAAMQANLIVEILIKKGDENHPK
jgi:sulfur carrier protein ThiS adenylyltransferase